MSRPAQIHVSVLSGGGTETHEIECMVLNMSETGAKISVPAADVPDRFVLKIDGEIIPRACQVMRRKG